VIHDDFASNGSAQTDLAVNHRSTQPGPTLLQYETADITRIIFTPNHEDISNRAVGDPHLATRQAIAAVDLSGPGDHRARVRAMIGFGQAETADPFAGSELGQILLFLRLGAKLVDRHHDQRGLHTHHRTITGVHALNFPSDQSVTYVIQAATAVLFGNRGAQQAN